MTRFQFVADSEPPPAPGWFSRPITAARLGEGRGKLGIRACTADAPPASTRR